MYKVFKDQATNRLLNHRSRKYIKQQMKKNQAGNKQEKLIYFMS